MLLLFCWCEKCYFFVQNIVFNLTIDVSISYVLNSLFFPVKIRSESNVFMKKCFLINYVFLIKEKVVDLDVLN